MTYDIKYTPKIVFAQSHVAAAVEGAAHPRIISADVRRTLAEVEQLVTHVSGMVIDEHHWGHGFRLPRPPGANYAFRLYVHCDGQCDVAAVPVEGDEATRFWGRTLETEDYDDLAALRSHFLECCNKVLRFPTKVVQTRQYRVLWDFDLLYLAQSGWEAMQGDTFVGFRKNLLHSARKESCYSSPAVLETPERIV